MLDGKVKDSRYPLLYHITPLKGLMNDPNGLIKYRERYHVFYQWNPYGTVHKNKCWGHVISKDMIHWERCPVALEPTEYYDKDGIYSGSAIVKDEILYLFYTGNVIGHDGEKKSYQCLAKSEDGVNFKKYGPLFEHPTGYTRHVRDPKVWLGENGCYWMILGAQRDELTGNILLYKSNDLITWVSQGSLIKKEQIQLGYMWECPDMLLLDSDILLFSPQGLKAENNKFDNIYQTGYLVGNFLESGEFAPKSLEFQELDRGFEFYAPQSFKDADRIILYGWMGIMPEEIEQNMPTISEGWVHCLSIPRTIKFVDDTLIQEPVEELKQMRSETGKKEIFLNEVTTHTISIAEPFAELLLEFEGEIKDFTIDISDSFWISTNCKDKQVIISRRNWYTKKIEKRVGIYNGLLQEMRIYLDGSVVEIFVNHGKLVFSSRYFSEEKLWGEIKFIGESLKIRGYLYPLGLDENQNKSFRSGV